MQHLGEIISLIVAMSWTVTALFADKASHRLGSTTANVLRLVMAAVFLAVILWVGVGSPYPVYADGKAWFWLAASAVVGYVFGDWCLFNCYLSIGARFSLKATAVLSGRKIAANNRQIATVETQVI